MLRQGQNHLLLPPILLPFDRPMFLANISDEYF